MSSPQEQCMRLKCEVEASLASARSLCDQWQAAMNENPNNLSKKEIDQLAKQFKNRLLTVKWDCEDLEEVVNLSEYELIKTNSTDIDSCRDFIQDCRMEISQLMEKLGEGDTKTKIFSKHGITFSNPSNAAASILSQNTGAKYERLTTNETDVVEFDIATANNSNNRTPRSEEKVHLSENSNYESRNTMNIHVNPQDSQSMLDMLETGYCNPHPMTRTSRLDFALRKFLESADRTKLYGIVAFMFSIPILLFLIM